MTAIRVGFAGGTTVIDKAIQVVSGGDYADITHAFIFLLDSIAEAEGIKEYDDIYPGFWLHPLDKFALDKTARFIEIEIPSLRLAEMETRKLIGSAYGYSSCLSFVLRKFFHINFPDNRHSCDCSEAQTLILRAAGLPMYPRIQANEVSPLMAFKWVMNHGGKDVTDRFRKR